MERIVKIVQFASNLGIIILTLLVGFVVFKEYVFVPTQSQKSSKSSFINNLETPVSKSAEKSLIGKPVDLHEVNWKENKTTLVLYISTTCHFCRESSIFYQRIVKEKNKSGVKMVAVFPQTTNEATNYLKSQHIEVDQILNGSLSSVGVSGTPTILLVDGDGVVSDSWRGKLKADKEDEVLAKLTG